MSAYVGPYVTADQVRRRCGGFLDIQTRDGNPSIGDDDIIEYISEAQSLVDSRLCVRYNVPFNANGATPDPMIVRVTRDLAAADSLDQVQAPSLGSKDEFQSAYIWRKKAIDLLDQLQNGGIQLQNVPMRSRFLGWAPLVDVRNIWPESYDPSMHDPTNPADAIPRNAAGQPDSDLMSP